VTDLRTDENIVFYNEQLKKGPAVLLINALLTIEDFPKDGGKYFGMLEIVMALITATMAKDGGKKK
jgi:hypothetical protein